MTYEMLVNNVCDANETHIEHPFAKPEIIWVGFELGGLVEPFPSRKYHGIIYNPEYGIPFEEECDCSTKRRR